VLDEIIEKVKVLENHNDQQPPQQKQAPQTPKFLLEDLPR